MPLMRIAFAQVFSAESALKMLDQIKPISAPEIVVLPEYCFDSKHLPELRSHSSRLNRTAIITAMVAEVVVANDGVYRRNRAVRFVGGKEHPIYNKIQSELNSVEGDETDANFAAFRGQNDRNDHVFVSICNDKESAKQVIRSKALWLIPGRDSSSTGPIVPPRDFIGNIIFANGHRSPRQSSYWMQLDRPRAVGAPDPQPTLVIPPDEERMETISIAV